MQPSLLLLKEVVGPFALLQHVLGWDVSHELHHGLQHVILVSLVGKERLSDEELHTKAPEAPEIGRTGDRETQEHLRRSVGQGLDHHLIGLTQLPRSTKVNHLQEMKRYEKISFWP